MPKVHLHFRRVLFPFVICRLRTFLAVLEKPLAAHNKRQVGLVAFQWLQAIIF
jgi:hypothetical protein